MQIFAPTTKKTTIIGLGILEFIDLKCSTTGLP